MIYAEELEKLRGVLWEYLGQQNERLAGVKVKREDLVEKPEALIRYEQVREFGIPYVAGGLYDQPYLTMLEHGVVKSVLSQWDAIPHGSAQSNVQTPSQQQIRAAFKKQGARPRKR